MFRLAIVAILAPVLIVSACSSDGPEDASLEPPGVPTSPPGETAAPEAVSVGAGQWDPASWEPTVRIAPRTFTEAEREQFRVDWLASWAEARDLVEPPAVELVRWTIGNSDYGEAVGACLIEHGFAAVHDGFGGFHFPDGIPAAQDQAFALASYTCEARYTPDPGYRQDWTEDQLGLVYDYWEQYFIPCMGAHGHEISTAGMPSREAYVAAFFTPERISWWPNDAFFGLSGEEQGRLLPACPPYPPDDIFYGS